MSRSRQRYKVFVVDGFIRTPNLSIVYDGLSPTSAYEKYEECASKVGTRYAHVEIVKVLDSKLMYHDDE